MKSLIKIIIIGLSLLTTLHLQAQDSSLTAEQIVEKYVKAIGGREKLDSIETLVLKGNAQLSNLDMFIPLSIFIEAPDKLKMEMELFEKKILTFKSREEGWSYNPFEDEARLQLTQYPSEMNSLFDFISHNILYYQDFGFEIEYLGKVSLSGEVVHHIQLSNNTSVEDYFFDTKSFLLKTVKFDNGKIVYSNYQAINNIKIPFNYEVPKKDFVMSFTSAKANIGLPDSIFDKPIISFENRQDEVLFENIKDEIFDLPQKGLTAEAILGKYLKAYGFTGKVFKVKTVKLEAKIGNSQFSAPANFYAQASGRKVRSEIELADKQIIIIQSGDKYWQKNELIGEESFDKDNTLDNYPVVFDKNNNINPFLLSDYKDGSYDYIKYVGITEIRKLKTHVIKLSQDKKESYYFFDFDTFLMRAKFDTEDLGFEFYDKHELFSDIVSATYIENIDSEGEKMIIEIDKMTFNLKLDPKLFKIPKRK